MKSKPIYILLAAALSPLIGMAQTAVPTPDTHTPFLLYSLILIALVIVLVALLSLAFVAIKMSEMMRIDLMKAKGTYVEPAAEKEDYLTRIWRTLGTKLTDRVPPELEASIDMGHNYDGIHELDNNLPPWWKAMFYASIIFGIGYLYYYHLGGGGKSAKEDYEQEVDDARIAKVERLSKQADMVNEDNAVALTDAASIDAGKMTFTTLCKPCHGANGEGIVGPNLTDDYWLHGGGIHNIFKTIKYGVPAKGMISWESQLPPRKIQEVASYILTLRGTNPPNAKAPQGDLWVPGKDSSSAPAISDTTKTTNAAL